MSGRPKRTAAQRLPTDDHESEPDEDVVTEDSDDEADYVKPANKAKRTKKALASEADHEVSEIPITVPDSRLVRQLPSDCGWIKRIEVQNFMNHTHLECSFSPKINFIHGPNGSGKSAIAAAMMACLGASARDTNRGTSLTSLIQTGKDSAKVMLVLSNKGTDAFEPANWGTEIVIERRLKRVGGSSFKVFGRDDQGKQVTDTFTSATQVATIVDFFNIQGTPISNPCIVMTQDKAREFLTTGEDGLYKFFMQATQLSPMLARLQEASDNVKIWDSNLQDGRTNLPALKRKMEDAKQEYDEASQLMNLQNDLAEVLHENICLSVHEMEDTATQAAELAAQHIQSLDELEKKVEDCASKENRLSLEHADLSRKIDEEDARDRERLGMLQKFQDAVKKAKKEVDTEQYKLDSMGKSLTGSKSQLTRLQKERDALLRDSQRDRSKESQSTQNLLENKKQKLADKQREESELKNVSFEDEMADLEQKLDRGNVLLEETTTSKRKLEDEIQQLKNAQRNRTVMFGAKAAEVNALIQRERFEQVPVGPLGEYIRLQDQKYANQIAFICKNQLESYACSNYADMTKLKTILNKVYGDRSPSIIVQQVSDVKYSFRLRPDCPYPAAVQVVDIANPWVFNVILTQSAMEKWLLADTNDASVMSISQDFLSMAQSKPNAQCSGVKGILDVNMSQYQYKGGSLAFFQNPSQPQGHRFAQDHTETINETTRRLTKVAHDADFHRRAVGEMQQSFQKLKSKREDHVKELKAIRATIHRTESEINDLENQLSGFQEDNKVDTTTIDHKISVSQATIEETENDIDAQKQSLQAAQERVAKAEATLRSQSKASQPTDDGSSLTDQMKECLRSFDKAKSQLKTAQSSLVKAQSENNDLKKKAAQAKQSFETARAKVPNLLDRDKIKSRNAAAAQRQVETIRKRIDVEKSKVRQDVTVLQRKFHEAEEKFNQLTESIEHNQRRLEDLKESHSQKEDEWRRFRKTLSDQVNHIFGDLLQRRGHSGGIEFHHKTASLELKVTLNSKSGMSSTVRDAMNMSGGERSYTTISYVLALGSSLLTPFRLMDEFDVFMDTVNRKVVIQLLLEVAKETKGQFFFLSPQDISGLGPSVEMKVFKLDPPDRNQGVLPFARQ